MNNHQISLLMANYNNSEYISQAIESVLAQTIGNWEIIIVDDASEDNSISVMNSFKSDSRIRVFEHNNNLGCGAAKRRCAKEAKGGILAILDPDDTLHPRALEKISSEYIRDPEIGFVYSTHYECDENLKPIRINPWIGDYNAQKTNLLDIKTGHLKSFKKELYLKTDGFDPFFKKAVDKDLIYKMEEVAKFKFLSEPLYYYRMTDKGLAAKGRMSQEARLWETRAKYNAFMRRRNMNIANLTSLEMRIEAANSIARALRYGFYKETPSLLRMLF